MATLGYERVSTADQTLDLQLDALARHGCDRYFADRGYSGAKFNRPGLDQALAELKMGDIFVVWRLDRLGRSVIELIQFTERLAKRAVHFRSLTEQIDTTSSGGRLFFHMLAALAEFERQLISERTVAGLSVAKQRGAKLGRPPKVTPEILEAARRLLKEGKTLNDISHDLTLSRKTLTRYLCHPRDHL